MAVHNSLPSPIELRLLQPGATLTRIGGRLGKAQVDSHDGLMDKGKYNESGANGYDIPAADPDARAETRISCE